MHNALLIYDLYLRFSLKYSDFRKVLRIIKGKEGSILKYQEHNDFTQAQPCRLPSARAF